MDLNKILRPADGGIVITEWWLKQTFRQRYSGKPRMRLADHVQQIKKYIIRRTLVYSRLIMMTMTLDQAKFIA